MPQPSQSSSGDPPLAESASNELPRKGRTDGFFCVLAYGVLLFGIPFSIYLLNLARNIKEPVVIGYHVEVVALAVLSAVMGYRRTDNPSGATLILLVVGLPYLVLILPGWVISVLSGR